MTDMREALEACRPFIEGLSDDANCDIGAAYQEGGKPTDTETALASDLAGIVAKIDAALSTQTDVERLVEAARAVMAYNQDVYSASFKPPEIRGVYLRLGETLAAFEGSAHKTPNTKEMER